MEKVEYNNALNVDGILAAGMNALNTEENLPVEENPPVTEDMAENLPGTEDIPINENLSVKEDNVETLSAEEDAVNWESGEII